MRIMMTQTPAPSLEYTVQPFETIPAYVVVAISRVEGRPTQRGLCWAAHRRDAELIRDTLSAFANVPGFPNGLDVPAPYSIP